MKNAFLGLAVTAYLALSAGSPPTTGHDDGFGTFWTGFRQAALRNDMGKLASLTRLPLQVGFEADQDRVKTVSKMAFPAFLRAELACQSSDGDTNAVMIRRNVQPAGRFDFHDNTRAIVGVFSFNREPEGWRFSQLNLGDVGEYKSLLHGHCS